MTGDLWQMTGPNVTCRTRKFKFEEISYVKRITRQEAQVALRDHYKDDLMDHEYEGPDFQCVDEDADLNLSESDDEPSKCTETLM
jgi:hypothetical protein